MSLRHRQTPSIDGNHRATSLPSRAEGGRKPGKGRRRRRRTLPPAGLSKPLLNFTGVESFACDDRPQQGCITIPDRYGRRVLPTFAAPIGFRLAAGYPAPIERLA